jgi:hypothetical protein
LAGELSVSLHLPSVFCSLLLPRASCGTALETVRNIQTYRFMITWQVTSEPIRQRS